MQDPLQRRLPSGALVDLVTPFHSGALDTDALADLVRWQVRNGIAGIVVLGQAGEATSLNRDERALVIRTAIAAAAGQVPLFAGTGTNATATTCELTRDAKMLGADAALIVTPYYNKPSQAGIVQHYEQVASAVEIPIIICNSPMQTAADLAPQTLERLAAIRNIVGIQDCTGDIARLAQVPPHLRTRFRLYSGHDLTAFAFNLAGGAGTISIAANIAPRYVGAMHDALRTGNLDAAFDLAGRINPLLQALAREPGPASIKRALHVLNGLDPEVRLPLTPPALEATEAIRMALASSAPGDRRAAV